MKHRGNYSFRNINKESICAVLALTMISTTGCTVFGVESVEEASYDIVEKQKRYEIRDYAPMIAVETTVDAGFEQAGGKAFRKLFGYISGENTAKQKISMTAPVIAESNPEKSSVKIAMTAPVTAQQEGQAWRFQFVLPKKFTAQSAPAPLNPEVSLVEVPSKRVAVLRYAGSNTQAAQNKNVTLLKKWIESKGLQAVSAPRWAGYNPPWTLPPFRRNEVLIDISGQ